MALEDIEAEAPAAPAAPGIFKLAGSVGAAIFLAVLGAELAAPLLTKLIYGDPDAPAEEAVETAALIDEPAPPGEDFRSLEPAIYVPLDPPLLASFDDPDVGSRYLQLSVQAMGRSAEAMEAVRQHAPALRNAFLFLMSNMKYADIATAAGKEQLRAEMLAEAQAILVRNTGEPGIEELYFTSLVVQ